LRDALSDTAGSPRYIETVARRGYRFIADVQTIENDDPIDTAGDPAELGGEVIAHFRVLEKLGSGAMGVVYRAEDLRLGRFVAIKVLADGLAANPDARARFE